MQIVRAQSLLNTSYFPPQPDQTKQLLRNLSSIEPKQPTLSNSISDCACGIGANSICTGTVDLCTNFYWKARRYNVHMEDFLQLCEELSYFLDLIWNTSQGQTETGHNTSESRSKRSVMRDNDCNQIHSANTRRLSKQLTISIQLMWMDWPDWNIKDWVKQTLATPESCSKFP